MARNSGKHRFRQSPTFYFSTANFFSSISFGWFLAFWDFYSSGTLRKRSGTLRNHPETFCNDLECLEFIENDSISSKNHSKTSTTNAKIIHGWSSMEDHPWMIIHGWLSMDDHPWMIIHGWSSMDDHQGGGLVQTPPDSNDWPLRNGRSEIEARSRPDPFVIQDSLCWPRPCC